MDFLKRKLAVAGAVLSVIVSVSLLGNSLIYGFSEDYKSWKQYGSSWSTMNLGSSSDTVKSSGCAVTAAAILMVHSGSVTNEDFNPGVMVEYLNQNGGLDAYGCLNWWALSSYAPDFKYATDADNVLHGTTQAEKAQEIKNFLDNGYYVMVRISNGKNTHFVAVDSVKGSRVIMMDPGSTSTSLFEKYDVSTVTQVRLFTGKHSSSQEETAVPETEAPETTANTEASVQDAPETTPIVIENTITEIETEIEPETETEPEVIIRDIIKETSAVATEAPVITTTTAITTAVPAETTTTAVTTTTTAPVTAIPVTTTEIVITTKAPVQTEAPVASEEIALTSAVDEIQPETINEPVGEEFSGQIEVILQDAPETAPVSEENEQTDSKEIKNTKTIYIPEEQAEATLIEIREQYALMSIRFTVNADLNLHTDADADSEILTVIPANTSLNVVETDDNFKWGRVLYDGFEGWIALNFAEL